MAARRRHGHDAPNPETLEAATAAGNLREENKRLKAAVATMQASRDFGKVGPLFYYDTQASSLFTSPWTRRHYVLSGATLYAYAPQAALATAESPRPVATTNVSGLAVVTEGVKVGRFFAFRLVEPTTNAVVLRLSSDAPHEGAEWVAALEAAARPPGAPPPTPPYSRDVSPSLSADSGTVGGAMWRRMHHASGATPQSATSASADAKPTKQEARSPMQASTPVHRRNAVSILSSEQISLHRHSGIINLAMVIIAVTHSRLVVENLKKYGMLFSLRFWLGTTGGSRSDDHLPLLVCYMCHPLFSLAALMLEKALAASSSKILDAVLRTLYAGVLIAVIAIPCRVIDVTKSEPLPGFGLLAVSVVLGMKLYSYSEANAYLRAMRRRSAPLAPSDRLSTDVAYPANLTVGNLTYFIAAPTLCYQVSYPRTLRVRKRWLFRRIVEWLFYQALTLFMVEQYMIPTVSNALKGGALDRLDFFYTLERILKLSLPNLYVWLSIFYALFHLWLNILAEILRFGDRDFYRDWWNASDLEEYWRTWNMPVHRWMLRHVYHPAVRQGVPKALAMILVFFVSAVGHELLIGVPCHVMTTWAFWGIMGQVPLILLTKWLRKKLKNEHVGNVLFWVSFCIFGQPATIMLYMREFLRMHPHGLKA